MDELKISELIGKNCITMAQGETIYNKIHPVLKSGNSVSLNFLDVEVFASPFFNRAVGRLLQDISPVDLNQHLKVTNLTSTGLDILKKVIENSKKYYQNPAFKNSVDQTLKDRSEGN